MKPGIYQITMQEYLAFDALSSGVCHTLLTQSALHAKHEQASSENDASEVSDTGTAIHDCLLEGIDRIAVIDAKDWRTNAAKEARDEARSRGKIPMLAHKVPNVEAAVRAARAFVAGSELEGIFDTGESEKTLVWDDDGVLCKARPDWLSKRALIHVKTTDGSAQADNWIRNQLGNSGYATAWGFYERAARAFLDKPLVHHLFLVIEQNAPYGCSWVGLDPAYQELARANANRAISMWRKCKQTGHYPAYDGRVHYAMPAAWQMNEHEERLLTDPMQEQEGLQA